MRWQLAKISSSSSAPSSSFRVVARGSSSRRGGARSSRARVTGAVGPCSLHRARFVLRSETGPSAADPSGHRARVGPGDVAELYSRGRKPRTATTSLGRGEQFSAQTSPCSQGRLPSRPAQRQAAARGRRRRRALLKRHLSAEHPCRARPPQPCRGCAASLSPVLVPACRLEPGSRFGWK